MKKSLLILFFTSVVFSQSDGLTVISNNGGGEQNIFTALITNDYDIHNIWYHPSPVHSIAYIQKDSTLIAPLIIDNAIMPLSVMASGGRFQKLNWEGDVIWDFFYFDTLYNPHHDIEPLPNGNILVICWEVKTQEEAESMGRVNIDGEIWPTKIVELQPPNGTVVWEWHLWDHLIQDVDPSLPNYGVVSDHPELLDINKGAPVNNVNGDWLHANAITHNEDLDQIIFSSRHMNEIYVIDHSTTSEEVAGHSGGNSGKGGDFLYRWGNPMNYDRGTINDRRIVAPHGANWVESSFPGGGNIMIFNNNPYDDGEGGNSEAIEIDPPVDLGGDYYISPDSAFGPSEPVWTHGGDSTYFSGWQGGAYRLHNGNTLISVAQQRFIFEVDINNEIVWQCHVGANLGWSGNPLRAYKLEPSFFLNNSKALPTPSVFKINQNYPNPFNPVTNIHYELPEDSFVTISIYDLKGRVITTLINRKESAGYKSVIWNATNNQGNPVSAGVYLYQIHAGDFVQTKKMVLLK